MEDADLILVNIDGTIQRDPLPKVYPNKKKHDKSNKFHKSEVDSLARLVGEKTVPTEVKFASENKGSAESGKSRSETHVSDIADSMKSLVIDNKSPRTEGKEKSDRGSQVNEDGKAKSSMPVESAKSHEDVKHKQINVLTLQIDTLTKNMDNLNKQVGFLMQQVKLLSNHIANNHALEPNKSSAATEAKPVVAKQVLPVAAPVQTSPAQQQVTVPVQPATANPPTPAQSTPIHSPTMVQSPKAPELMIKTTPAQSAPIVQTLPLVVEPELKVTAPPTSTLAIEPISLGASQLKIQKDDTINETIICNLGGKPCGQIRRHSLGVEFHLEIPQSGKIVLFPQEWAPVRLPVELQIEHDDQVIDVPMLIENNHYIFNVPKVNKYPIWLIGEISF